MLDILGQQVAALPLMAILMAVQTAIFLFIAIFWPLVAYGLLKRNQ